jgi:L-ascorbate metabolism protein UlaG (beta-lactamase superfamily)
VKGVAILGYESARDASEGSVRGMNTIFSFDSEEIRLCFLGALGHPIDEKTVAKIGDVDILFVPIGDGDTLPTKQVDELIRQIEPRVVIPMHYRMAGMTDIMSGPEVFCKDMGCSLDGASDKFTFKKKDIEEKSMEVLFLERG